MKLTTQTKNIIEKVSGIVLITIIIGFLIWLIFQAHYSAGYEVGIQKMVSDTTEAEKTSPEPTSSEIQGVLVPDDAYQMRITAFSSECPTRWCLTNLGKSRDTDNDGLNDVALNAKYGKWSKIYIPAYGKYYSVIGTTDQYTDVDVWYDTDYQSAKEFGSKNLLVYLIK